jgi:hypothetical protein
LVVAFPVSPSRRRVALTSELERVAGIPRRVRDPVAEEALAARMTELLKTPHGQMRLRPAQAFALYEFATVGGMFGPLRVGLGKTIISLLAPTVLQRSKRVGFRPLLVVPAGLVEKTERDRRLLVEHWDIAPFLKIMSYEWLGRVQAAEALKEFAPDLVVLDECHRARNRRGCAAARRLERFFREHPGTHCLAMSGTITKRSIRDYAHILCWCLPAAYVPVPLHFQDLEDWADALDEKKEREEGDAVDPGALRALCQAEEEQLWDAGHARRAARVAFRRRLVETSGVVTTDETPIDASLSIRLVRLPGSVDCVEDAFAQLRANWETPDGEPVMDGLEMFRHARELALGFFYRWDPVPPRSWLEPRRIWAKFVRETLKHSRRFDSELQVRQWASTLPKCVELRDWLAVRDTFTPNTVPVWLDDSVLRFVADWARSHKGIAWIEHQCFGQRLENEFGLPYYGKLGRDATKRLIDDHPRDKSMAASIASNKEGRNLQAWCENLIVSTPANGLNMEQLLGRTHRDGQEADEVTVDVVVNCAEHYEAFEQARRDADYIQTSTGSPQKLLLAGVDGARENFWGLGPRWNK